jgi:hypothetical protein
MFKGKAFEIGNLLGAAALLNPAFQGFAISGGPLPPCVPGGPSVCNPHVPEPDPRTFGAALTFFGSGCCSLG